MADQWVVPVRPEGTPIDRLARFTIAVSLAVAVFCLGCAGMAWKKALKTDSATGYYQYIRAHPNSRYIAAAQERIEFHKVVRRPSLRGFNTFRAAHPDSALLPDLRKAIEELAFDSARARGTVAAFRRFEAEFPDSALALRAAANARYLTAQGFPNDPAALSAFASAHPESDFAAEAQRSVAALDTRARTRSRRVGLEIKVARGTPEAKRIAKAFTDRAAKIYRDSGLQLVTSAATRSGAGSAPEMRLVIRHGEKLESAHVEGGDVSRAGVVARTQVTLRRGAKGPVVWSRNFQLRVLPHERIAGASLLFASEAAELYWEEFFVPVATWQSSAAVRSALEVGEDVVAVDADHGRAVVLLGNGDFQLWGLSDPEAPALLAAYDRASEIEHFDGVRIMGERVVLFGQDGLEIVGFGPEGLQPVVTHSRGEVGSIAALQPTADGMLLASSKGLLLSDRDGGKARRVMRRIVLGMAAIGDKLVFTDGDSVFVSTLELLRQERVTAKLRLGREFKPSHVRVAGHHAIVMGEGGFVVLDIASSEKPRLVAKLNRASAGEVRDALSMDDQIFLVGERGVQLLDLASQRIVEAVDVLPRQRVARAGRHLVLVGDDRLQMVDALPFREAKSVPAKRTH